MKNLLYITSLFALAACGLSEDKFAEKAADKFCEACDGEEGFECPETEETDDSAYEGCEYDAKAAKECLKGEWSCNTDFAPLVFAEGPEVCADVYVCDGATTGTTTGTTGTTSGS